MTDPRIDELKALIRDIPDFPKKGILFKDITTLLADPKGFNTSLDMLVEELEGVSFDAIAGMESRGFIFGAALAARMHKPFIPVRKPGRLPAETVSIEYALEYGTDTLEIHKDAVTKGDSVLIIDDLIATGGTAAATGELVTSIGAEVAAYAFVIDLTFLGGKAKLGDHKVISLLEY